MRFRIGHLLVGLGAAAFSILGCASTKYSSEWRRDEFYLRVQNSEAIVVARVVRADPSVGTLWRWDAFRTAVLSVEEVVFGIPATDSLKIEWYDGPRRGSDVPKVNESVSRRGLWMLDRQNGGWRLKGSQPTWLDGISTTEADDMLVSLDKAPRDYWRDFLSPAEAHQMEVPILAVRNFITARIVRSN